MRAIVTGSSGFIGQYLVRRLKSEGYYVLGIDKQYFQYGDDECHEFWDMDLRREFGLFKADEVYALAADMGGAGHVFTGEHDAEIMTNNARINQNTVEACRSFKVGKVFFASSACVYPDVWDQQGKNVGIFEDCEKSAEDDIELGLPDSDYGLEKLFSERLYQAYTRNYGLNVKIARFHNVFGPLGTWQGGREKAPAAICRKVAEVEDGGTIEIWGDGTQVRSFLYIDEAIEGIRRLMQSDFAGPVNIGSEYSVTIADLVHGVARIAGKSVVVGHISGPTGVQGRNSDNTLIKQKLGWAPSAPLEDGLRKTYEWISERVRLAGK